MSSPVPRRQRWSSADKAAPRGPRLSAAKSQLVCAARRLLAQDGRVVRRAENEKGKSPLGKSEMYRLEILAQVCPRSLIKLAISRSTLKARLHSNEATSPSDSKVASLPPGSKDKDCLNWFEAQMFTGAVCFPFASVSKWLPRRWC